MNVQPGSAIHDSSANQHEMRWSRSERTIARRAFDAALKLELQEVTQQAKQMASRIKQPSDLWELEHYLTRCRKKIDRKYEYRSSKLILVLGALVHEGRISEQELRGLQEDKLESILSYARFMAKIDAT